MTSRTGGTQTTERGALQRRAAVVIRGCHRGSQAMKIQVRLAASARGPARHGGLGDPHRTPPAWTR
jgi:hypothetical protein